MSKLDNLKKPWLSGTGSDCKCKGCGFYSVESLYLIDLHSPALVDETQCRAPPHTKIW